MKFMDVLKTALGNLWRNKVRTILTILATFIGAFTIAVTAGINIGVNSFVDNQADSIGGRDFILVLMDQDPNSNDDDSSGPVKYNPDQMTSSGNPVISDHDIEILKNLKGVKELKPWVEPQFDYIQGVNGDRFTFAAQEHLPSMTQPLKAGTYPSNNSNQHEVLINDDYVEALGFKKPKDAIGTKLTLAATTAEGVQKEILATIVGVQEKNILLTNGAASVNRSLNEEVIAINQEGVPEGIIEGYVAAAVIVEDEKKVDKIKDEINDLGGYNAMTLEDQLETARTILNAVTSALVLFGVIALIAATFGIVNTLFMSVQERTREIGLMKALGLSRGKVFSIFAWEAILIGFFGAVFGLLAAMGLGTVINALAEETFLADLPGMTLVQFTVVPSLLIIGLIMLIAFVAGALPARRAAKMDPINALRSE